MKQKKSIDNGKKIVPEWESEVSYIKENIIRTLVSRRNTLIAFIILVFVVNIIFSIPIHQEIYILIVLWLIQNYLASKAVIKSDSLKTIKNIYFLSSILVFLLLTFIIYYLGTVEWVGFVLYFISIIFNSFILSSKKGLAMAAIASFLYVTLVLGEYFGFLIHQHPLFFTPGPNLHQNTSYVLITGIAIPVLMFFIVGITSAIFSSILRKEASGEIIINNMGDGMLLLDAANKVLRVNSIAKDLLEIKGDIIGQPLSNVASLPVNWNAEEIVKTMTRGGTSTYKITVGDPPIRVLESLQTKFKQEDGTEGIIMILRDTTPPWGTIYNSKTKEPEELVIVRVFDAADNRLLEAKVTDKEGRFSFLVPPGRYYLTVRKENFIFPSKGKGNYQGDIFEKGVMINFNISIDPK